MCVRETEHDLSCRNTEDSGNFIAQNIGVFQTEADMIDCQQAAQEIAQPPDSGLQGKRTVCRGRGYRDGKNRQALRDIWV